MSIPRQAIGESQLPIDWDITTGKNILWSVPLGSETNGSPVVAGGKVYIGTNNGHGYLKRYPPEVDLGCLLCFDAKNGDGIVSYSERLHRTLSNVAIKDDLLILPDLGGVVHCLNAKTGEVHWTCDLLDQVWATPLIANDHVFVPTDGGCVAIFYMSADPSRAMTKDQGQYKPLRTIDMDSPIHATPTAVGNVLYIATSKRLYAIALP